MSALANPRLPKGSTILVTGVTGYIGAWVAEEALAMGYKVRGGVRSIEKAAWLQSHFDKSFPGQYSQVELADVSDIDAFKIAIKDVAGVIHVAANLQLSAEPAPYIPDTIRDTLAYLRAADAEESVKSFVWTSSSMSAVEWGATGAIAKDAYSEGFIQKAWDPAFEHPAKMFVVYAASKAQAEQAAFKYVQEEKPHFTLNIVLPSCNMGPSLVFEKQGFTSTGGWPKALYDGDLSFISNIPPQFFIDVRDTGKLHVAALVDPETSNERLWGFAEKYNWNSVLAYFRKFWPDKKFIDDIEGLGWDGTTVPTESALKTLKNVYGQDSWTGIETSLKDSGFDKA
ncbi:hypothetical protein DE146DRAFT_674224 [Phaeosphaeria sp. MPI-PUGE-AT-0046c]|nr:hypothetical protein DE146DRAFT_674224 [Phaeosphaeria sp. MPI-PUGE-AT-0046c]